MDDTITAAIRQIVREELDRHECRPAYPPTDDLELRGVLNSDQAASYCGFRGGGQTMRDLKQKDPDLPWHKLGKLLVFYPEELDTWISSKSKGRV